MTPETGPALRELVERSLTPLDVDSIVAARRARRARRRAAVAMAGGVVAAIVAVAAVVAGNNSPSRPTHVEATSPGGTQPVPTNPNPTPTRPTVPPTTTHAAPAGPRAFAPVTASFISPEHGFALEAGTCDNGPGCSFRLMTTLDGGATWRQVARVSLASVGRDVTMRFADAAHGFLFNGLDTLVTTSDGGVHWQVLFNENGQHAAGLPFDNVNSVDVARGRVYVTAFAHSAGSSTPAGFALWSAPADLSHWDRDPVLIPVGAGPVPSQQFTFAPGAGWMVNNDRTVISGARLGATGPWQAWTPPCTKVFGSAELAASTSRDLVALCAENAWGGTGGPPTYAVYFSHDGGATFHRNPTQSSSGGLIASPTPHTAVLSNGPFTWRTTDDGATWHVVLYLQGAAGSPTDIGFTTPTQGFVVFDRGGMYMTRDGGATWSHVALG